MSLEARQQYFNKVYDSTLKLGGSGGYGRWHQKLASLESVPALWQEWENRTVRVARNYEVAQFIDAGCGNGAYGIPYAERFSRRCNAVEAHLVDIQPEGIHETATFIEASDLPSNIRFNLQTADLAQLPIPDQSVHGVFTNMVMHWLEPERTQEAFREFHRVLVDGGYALIDTCSIYNAMSVGINDNERLNQVRKSTNEGRTTARHPVWHKGFQRWTYLFTEPGLRQSLHYAGLTIRRLEWYKNGFPNGQSNKYKEGIRTLVQKA